ncbi:MAG: rod shape-determining protein MreD [Rikenellaceae bacterium]
MIRSFPYFLLYFAVLLMQVFLFDKLLIFSTMAPLVYIIFIILLPVQLSQFQILMWGAFVGVTFDLAMGTSGLNSIATIFVSYLRFSILSSVVDKDLLMLGGAPTQGKIGFRRFSRYLFSMVYIHSAIFFVAESLNFVTWDYLLMRILVSGLVSVVAGWLIAGPFEKVLSRKF